MISLLKDTSLVNFHDDPISSFYVKLLTDRQTNACWVEHTLLGRNNERKSLCWIALTVR